MSERLRKIKEEPIIDERVPHPYREFAKELRAIRELLERISEKLPAAVAVPTAVAVPIVFEKLTVEQKAKIPAIQLPKKDFINMFLEGLEKYDALKLADDLYVQTIDLSTDRSTDTLIEELKKFKNAIAITIFRNTGTFDLYINEKNTDHKLDFDALTYPQTFLLDWFRVKTIYVGNAIQSGKEAKLIAWKRLS